MDNRFVNGTLIMAYPFLNKTVISIYKENTSNEHSYYYIISLPKSDPRGSYCSADRYIYFTNPMDASQDAIGWVKMWKALNGYNTMDKIIKWGITILVGIVVGVFVGINIV